MMRAELADGRVLEFPDGTDPAVIQATVKRVLGAQMPTRPERPAAPAGADPFQQQAQEPGFLQTGAISTGRGLAKIGRALGLVDPESETERRAFEALGKERPAVTAIGEAVGESLPFALVPVGGLAAGAGKTAGKIGLQKLGGFLAGRGGQIAGQSGIGALEGALIARGEGASGEQQFKSGGVGGAAAGALEAGIPYLGRFGGWLFRKITKRAPKGALIDAAGQPTAELTGALDSAGLSFDDLAEGAEQLAGFAPGTDPGQAARAARFTEAGIPATRGDITQDVAQQGLESRLFESVADPGADSLRALRLDQSEKVRGKFEGAIDNLGVPAELGSTLKDVLSGRKSMLKKQKNMLYKEAIDRADDIGGLPLPVDAINQALPDARTLRVTMGREGAKTEEFLDLMAEFGVDQTDEGLDRLARKGIEPQPLNIANFELFRQELNRIQKVAVGQPDNMGLIVGPIRDALDLELEGLSGAVSNVAEIAAPLKEARKTVRQIKTEFSPQAISGRLINSRPDGFTPVIEASKAFGEVVGPNKPIELLERTVKSLSDAGDAGKEALGNLQAAAVADIMEASFKANTRKIQGIRLMSPVAMRKRFDAIGPEKMKLIFADNPEALAEVNKLGQLAEDLTASFIGAPKGSAGVNQDIAMSLLSRVPGKVGKVFGGMSALSKMGGSANDVRKAFDATPELRDTATIIDSIAPEWFQALPATVQEVVREGKAAIAGAAPLVGAAAAVQPETERRQ